MSIRSDYGSFTGNTGNDIDAIMSNARSNLSNIFGNVETKFLLPSFHLFGDDSFAGMNENGLETLQGAIESFCRNVEDVIDRFNQDAKVEQAFKGPIAQAASDYVMAIKDFLASYVSLVRQEKVDAATAFQNYAAGAKAFATDVSSDAQAIRTQAQQMRIDN